MSWSKKSSRYLVRVLWVRGSGYLSDEDDDEGDPPGDGLRVVQEADRALVEEVVCLLAEERQRVDELDELQDDFG